MTTKTGIASSAMEVITLKAPTPGSLKSDSDGDFDQPSLNEQLELLKMCRKKVNNYRQPEALELLIEHAEEEALAMPYKIKKVDLNIYAMLIFSELNDEKMNSVLASDIHGLYDGALSRYGFSKKERDRLYENVSDTKQTTVEVNMFISKSIEDAILRANNLPFAQEVRKILVGAGKLKEGYLLYNGTEIRNLALLYYANLPLREKIKEISRIRAEYGVSKLDRFTGAQYEKKAAELKHRYKKSGK